MTLTYQSSSGKVLACRFDSDRSGYLNSLRFEIGDRHLCFYNEGTQIFPDPSVYETVRRFQRLANNQNLKVA